VRRLILARHGESEYSARGLLSGDATAKVPLTATGAEQARQLGRFVADEPLDLCVTSELARTRATAELALAGRAVPIEAWPDLNDPRAGRFEGRSLVEYRRWAWSAGSREAAPGGGESRLAAVGRYTRAYRTLLDRPEETVLAIVHALPIAYVLFALEGKPPAARMDRPIEYAHPYFLTAEGVGAALDVLESWSREPTW
jgi:broad specificity phosphatase PhoE